MAEDRIRYDILAQDALRGVMRKVLAEVARTGLPGEHHFFITFLTNAPGVRVSSRLRERYPEQMTIVLQYQYWDLKVSETGFEVGLSFADVPEMLSVPFSAVRGFYDPSVNFELEFDVKPEQGEQSADITEVYPEAADEPQKPAARKKPAKKARKEKAETENDSAKEEAPASEGKGTEGKGADVVSLDAFRKK
ncbi:MULTISPECIES: SspB family protein [unclassified Nitratireductor]|uniref:SspB family protein n=1 Tax=unclassified Nitratireductor TaxID=2641084 RepID=UPI0025DAF19B|nr:SspB family protein [Nitratireductor sp.]